MTLSLKESKIHYQEGNDRDREENVEKWSCRHHTINVNVDASMETYKGRMRNTSGPGDRHDAGDGQGH